MACVDAVHPIAAPAEAPLEEEAGSIAVPIVVRKPDLEERGRLVDVRGKRIAFLDTQRLQRRTLADGGDRVPEARPRAVGRMR